MKEKILSTVKNFFSNIQSANPDENRKKQFIVRSGLSLLFMAGGAFFMFSGDTNNKKISTPKTTDPKLFDDTTSAQTGWLASVSPKVDSSVENSAATQKLVESQTLRIDTLTKKLEEIEAKKNMPQNSEDKAKDIGKALNFKPGQTPDTGGESQNPQQSISRPPVVQQRDIQNSLAFEKVEMPKEKIAEKESARLFIPTGAFTKAVILQGINAPTMTKAKTSPLPVLLRLTDLSVIPNRKTFDLKECFVLGEGYGELASERVHIRTVTLSCVTKSGKNIDMPLKGYVVGGDGVTGVAGKVVSKQGAMLARTIIAGFFQGVGSAFGQTGQTLLSSPLGTTTAQPTDTGTIARSGAYQGASKAAEKLADFYMKMADSIEPVIEVQGGKHVEVVVSQGAVIEPIQPKKSINTEPKSNNDKGESK